MTVAFRFLAGIIVYVIIALVVVICVVGTIALWVVWYLKKTALGKCKCKREDDVDDMLRSIFECI